MAFNWVFILRTAQYARGTRIIAPSWDASGHGHDAQLRLGPASLRQLSLLTPAADPGPALLSCSGALKNLTNLPSDIFSGQHNRDGVWCICVPEGLLHLCNHGTCNLRTGKKVHSLKMQLLKKPRIIQNDLEAQTLAVRGQTSFSSHKTHASFEPVLTEGSQEEELLCMPSQNNCDSCLWQPASDMASQQAEDGAVPVAWQTRSCLRLGIIWPPDGLPGVRSTATNPQPRAKETSANRYVAAQNLFMALYRATEVNRCIMASGSRVLVQMRTEGKEKHLEEALEHPVPPRRPMSLHAAVAPSHCPAGAQDPMQELQPRHWLYREIKFCLVSHHAHVTSSLLSWRQGFRAASRGLLPARQKWKLEKRKKSFTTSFMLLTARAQTGEGHFGEGPPLSEGCRGPDRGSVQSTRQSAVFLPQSFCSLFSNYPMVSSPSDTWMEQRRCTFALGAGRRFTLASEFIALVPHRYSKACLLALESGLQ
ncbi:hypothetical protein Anapl_14122 [Anas platyrhynchos]|uniref:Uncharacterized protein n=1 Tax=Anas platyrhynchos TaxID=8839 RepID=R0L3U1_ANAPL|nr:hypothetical protein Anapl_14122 [Anas platyrhynchos]